MEFIATGLGLSSSAGLNAYLPLILFNLGVHFKLIEADNDVAQTISSWQSLGLFTLLLVIEVVVDKVPLLDTVNDIINTVVRPVAGAALMSASTAPLQGSVNPEMLQLFSFITGGTSAGGVHVVKALARPMITGSTGGTGNWAVSIAEDVLSLGMSILALALPFLMIFVAGSIVFLVIWWLWEMQRLDILKRQGYL